MQDLPVELRRAILQRLPLAELKNTRLACKSLALLGEDYLIPSLFTSLPHLPDTQRLECISQNPKYANSVRQLVLNHGEVNEYSARHNSYFLQYLMEPEARRTSNPRLCKSRARKFTAWTKTWLTPAVEQQHLTWSAYTHFKTLKETHLPASCDPSRLIPIFARLSRLTSISITLMSCPFPARHPNTPHLLPEIWSFPSTRLLNRVATVERASAVLSSVSVSSLAIASFKHDRLPFEFFVQKPALMETFRSAFRALGTLELALEYSDMPNNMHADLAFSNLGKCIQAAPLLQHLEIAMLGRRKIDIRPLLSLLAERDAGLQYLESFKLQGVITTEDSLSEFLLSLGSSLARAHLGGEGVRSSRQPSNGGVFLESGRWSSLAGRLGTEMAGVEVWVQGDLKELESGQIWIFDAPVGIGEFERLSGGVGED
ncbi:hypothetical protein JHW43_008722 [Diplocarpon mali]|nr:hypothetical protein JHW43_008722 [Diplocarpon mali]